MAANKINTVWPNKVLSRSQHEIKCDVDLSGLHVHVCVLYICLILHLIIIFRFPYWLLGFHYCTPDYTISITSAMQQNSLFFFFLARCSHTRTSHIHSLLCVYLNGIVHKLCKNMHLFTYYMEVFCILFAFMIFIVNFILIKLCVWDCRIDWIYFLLMSFFFFTFFMFYYSVQFSSVQFRSVQSI